MTEKELKNAVNKIHLTNLSKQKILYQTLNSKNEQEVPVMKFKKRTAILVAAALMICSLGVYAASGVVARWNGSSSSIPDYTTLPTKQECMKEIGYEPVLIDSFQTGYTFKEAVIVKNTLEDADGNNMEKFKSLNLTYTRGNSNLTIDAEKYSSTVAEDGKVIATIHDIPIYYILSTMKFVPADYKLTEEDKKAEKNGEYSISYGSDKVEIYESQALSFKVGDIHYSFFQFDYDGFATKDELIAMAKEIIEK